MDITTASDDKLTLKETINRFKINYIVIGGIWKPVSEIPQENWDSEEKMDIGYAKKGQYVAKRKNGRFMVMKR